MHAYLSNQDFECVIEPHSMHWFNSYWRDEADIFTEIWFDANSYADTRSYAKRAAKLLNQNGSFGFIEIADQGTLLGLGDIPSNEVLIVIPPNNTTLPPVEPVRSLPPGDPIRP